MRTGNIARTSSPRGPGAYYKGDREKTRQLQRHSTGNRVQEQTQLPKVFQDDPKRQSARDRPQRSAPENGAVSRLTPNTSGRACRLWLPKGTAIVRRNWKKLAPGNRVFKAGLRPRQDAASGKGENVTKPPATCPYYAGVNVPPLKFDDSDEFKEERAKVFNLHG